MEEQLTERSTDNLSNVLVGVEPWTINKIVDRILQSVSPEILSVKFMDIAILLKVSPDLQFLLRSQLSNGTITHIQAVNLLLEAWRAKNSKKAYLQVLIRSLEKSSLLECVESLRQQMTEVERAQSCLLVSPDEIVESTTWDDLSKELQYEMSNKVVLFQGVRTTFYNVCSQVRQFTDGRLLVELAKDDPPEIVNNKIPKCPQPYIVRNICKKICLTEDVFKNKSKDIIAIAGISDRQFEMLVEKGQSSVFSRLTKRIETRFVNIKKEENFENVCAITKETIHMVKYSKKCIQWLRSNGPVETIKNYILEIQDSFDESKLISDTNKVVLISDSPGTGKTSLLISLANRNITKMQDNMTLVRFFNIREFVQASIGTEHNVDSIVSTVAKLSSEFECGRKVVSNLLKSEQSMLFFDGFDELQPSQVPVALKILQEISKLPVVHIFVTTRPHMQEELENSLHTLCYTIKQIPETEQVSYLHKFWASQKVKVTKNVKKFASLCIRELATHISELEREVAGIPLQCRILADLHLKHAKLCSHQETSSFVIPKYKLIDLYERYINVQTNLDLTKQLTTMQSESEDLKNRMMSNAIHLLHPEFNNLYKLIISNQANSFNECFIHRSIAEYLFSLFVIENFKSEELANLFLSEEFSTKSEMETLDTPFGTSKTVNYYRFKQPSLPYFINSMFKPPSMEATYSDVISKIWNSHNVSYIAPVFIASAFHNLTPNFMASYFENSIEPNDRAPNETTNLMDLLFITAKHSDVELMEFFFSQIDIRNMSVSISLKSRTCAVTPLHVAAKRGYYKLVEYLLNNKYDPKSDNLRFVLHFCTFVSANDSHTILEEKKQIIALLLAKNLKWAEDKLDDDSTPLLQSRVHWTLIEFMIESKVDVNVLDDKENTILHKLVETPITAEKYHRIVKALRERGFMHFNKANKENRTPLHCAVEKIQLMEHTVKILESEGADFNAADDKGNSVVVTAINGGRSKEFISILDKLGANEMVQQMGTEKMLRLDGTKIRYSPDYELGHGATSTVYKGLYMTTPAAIKKLKSEFVDVFNRELNIWRGMRKTIEAENLNIISLYDFVEWKTNHGTAYFFAMELAICDLEKRVEQLRQLSKSDPQLLVEEQKLSGFIHGAAKGLNWMAKSKILHRDVKPANILIFATSTGDEIAKLGDFGISRKISGMSTGTDSAGRGTSDWMAPEAIKAMNLGPEHKFLSTKAIDIFSLGMSGHFAISLGGHPFVTSKKYGSIKVMNIMENDILPSTLGAPHYAADHLFQWMMKKSVKARPKIVEVVDHPYFWECEKTVDFLVDVAACLENKSNPVVSRIRNNVDNQYSKNGRYPTWLQEISPSATKALFYGKKSYSTPKNSIMMLVELIRDKFMHRTEMMQHDKDGVFTDGGVFSKRKYAGYFQATFPDVVVYIFCLLVKENPAALGELKISYFKNFGAYSSIKLL